FFFSSRRRHTRSYGDWSSDVCSSDLLLDLGEPALELRDELTQVGVGTRGSEVVLRLAPLDGELVRPLELLQPAPDVGRLAMVVRSEERRVGKECSARRWRWS